MNTETTKLLGKMNKAIERKNAKFNAMPIFKQRMALAKEILSLIATNKVKPTRGVYFEANLPKELHGKLPKEHEVRADPEKNINWQQLLPKLKKCSVCMLGVAVFASVKLRGNVTLLDVGVCPTGISWNQTDCLQTLSDLFTDDELEDMEGFFEIQSNSLTAKKSVEFFWKHILKNKGAYDSEKLLEEYAKSRKRSTAAAMRREKKAS